MIRSQRQWSSSYEFRGWKKNMDTEIKSRIDKIIEKITFIKSYFEDSVQQSRKVNKSEHIRTLKTPKGMFSKITTMFDYYIEQ